MRLFCCIRRRTKQALAQPPPDGGRFEALALAYETDSRFRHMIGMTGKLALRLRPGHPTDDLAGVAAWIFDGLLMSTSTAMIGSMMAVLIGERPGLSASDSLGAYLMWQCRIGRRDGERNRVSNIRHRLGHEAPADTIARLIDRARALRLTGVGFRGGPAGLPRSGRRAAEPKP